MQIFGLHIQTHEHNPCNKHHHSNIKTNNNKKSLRGWKKSQAARESGRPDIQMVIFLYYTLIRQYSFWYIWKL